MALTFLTLMVSSGSKVHDEAASSQQNHMMQELLVVHCAKAEARMTNGSETFATIDIAEE